MGIFTKIAYLCLEKLNIMDFDDITQIFREVIEQTGSIDMAEAEFKKMIGEDDELHKQYREYCMEVGSSERRGFLDFADEYMDNQQSVWDNLDDPDDRN